jgi:hypothetical protein
MEWNCRQIDGLTDSRTKYRPNGLSAVRFRSGHHAPNGAVVTLGENMTITTAIDKFTIRHLGEYASVSVEHFEREAFVAYALAAIEADPKLIEYGWPGLYQSFMHETYA